MSKTTKILLAVVGGILGLGFIIGITIWFLMAHMGGNIITEEQARAIALAHAEVRAADVEMLNVRSDIDDFEKAYDIEFYVGSAKYQYEIDAKTGRIEDFDVDGLKERHQIQAESESAVEAPVDGQAMEQGQAIQPETGSETTLAETPVGISEAEAAKTVLSKVPGAAETDLWIKIDSEDGKVVYEGKIIYDGMEYEFELDANDGTILSWDTERAEADDVPMERNYSESHYN